jgi:hypothetical protein
VADVWRPLTEADAKEWVRLNQAPEAVDRTEENLDTDDFAELERLGRVRHAATSSQLPLDLSVICHEAAVLAAASTTRAGGSSRFDRAGLGVDTNNATGALGVYERAGFTVSARWTAHGKAS